MDDAELVRRLERFGELPRDAERLGDRDRPLGDAFLERGALDELHDDRAGVAALFEAIDVRDERMIQRREHARFAFEPRQPVRIVDDRLGQDLDRDVALEAAVARAIDDAHTARTERADDLVGAEARTDADHFTGPR